MHEHIRLEINGKKVLCIIILKDIKRKNINIKNCIDIVSFTFFLCEQWKEETFLKKQKQYFGI